MFNKEKFSEILLNIVNQYESISDFANTSSVGRSYLSKYINRKISSPPSPKVLTKIANHSKGLITYEELMIICGHINNTASIHNINLDILKILNSEKTKIYKPLNKNEQKILNSLIKDFNLSILNNSDFDINSYIDNIVNITSKDSILNAFNIYNDKFNQYMQLVLSNTYYIPLLKCIKDFDNILSVENILDYIYLPENLQPADEFIAYSCNNNKMFPLLDNDDIAIIHKENNIISGSTYFIYNLKNNNVDIAKLIKKDTTIELIFMNPYFPSETYNIDDIKIIGKVVRAENKSAFI